MKHTQFVWFLCKLSTPYSDDNAPMRIKFAKNQWTILFIALWLGAIGAGLGILADYSATPGLVGQVPTSWPDNAPINRDHLNHTIIVSVHPRCPCTRATLDELEGVLTQSQSTPLVIALIFEPSADNPLISEREAEEFARTSITKRLQRIPGVQCIADPDSQIAQSFGALTSGHTLIYTPQGKLAFSGGLTPTRAHTGPNTGSLALKEILQGQTPTREFAPVFGCPLCPTESQNENIESCTTDSNAQCLNQGLSAP